LLFFQRNFFLNIGERVLDQLDLNLSEFQSQVWNSEQSPVILGIPRFLESEKDFLLLESLFQSDSVIERLLAPALDHVEPH
jgi:hypothetical protein